MSALQAPLLMINSLITLAILKSPTSLQLSKSQRASKSHQWFKSYGRFTEGVNFCLLVELHREGCAHPACAAGLSFEHTVFSHSEAST